MNKITTESSATLEIRKPIDKAIKYAATENKNVSRKMAQNEHLYLSIGARLKKARKDSGFKPKDICREYEAAISTIYKYENGDLPCPFEFLIYASAKYDCPLSYLVAGVTPPPEDEMPENILSFVNLLMKLSPQEREHYIAQQTALLENFAWNEWIPPKKKRNFL
ncbi:MAG: helix-turn-helix domain-containing protein [Lachnospiraceae bacterium]|nr:helix-turn-helix domain-containing protein [Lachnospiraceae bacterium]